MRCVQVLSDLVLHRLFGPLELNSAGASHGSQLASSGHHLCRALRQANARTWLAVQVLLAGEELWERAQLTWERSLETEFFQPLRNLIDSGSHGSLMTLGIDCRRRILQSLDAALEAGFLTSGALDLSDLLTVSAGTGSADDVGEGEWNCLERLVEEVKDSGYPDLAPLFKLRWHSGDAFLVMLGTALVRNAIQADPDLFGDVASALEKACPEKPGDEFRRLAGMIERHRAPLDSLVDEVRRARLIPGPSSSNAEASEAHLLRGTALSQRGEYERAIVEFTSALQHNPTLVRALVLRGDAYRLTGDYARALADYGAAKQLDSSDVCVLLNLGQIYSLLGRRDDAVAAYTAAIQVDSNNALAYHNRGKANSEAGNLDAAIADLSEAMRLNPQDAWACHHRGDAYAARGDSDQAIGDYSRALRLNPQAAFAYVHRADLYRVMGRHEEAVADYSEALRLDPLNLRALAQRGVLYRERGDLDQAAADFGRTLELDSANAEVLRQRGLVFQSQSEHRKALADFDAALVLLPEDADLYFYRAIAHEALGAADEALNDLDRTLRLNPNHTGAYDRRGQLYADRGKTHHALADFSAALRIDPVLAPVYANRAKVLARSGCLDDALADCEEALRQDSSLAAAYFVRGSALWQRGDYAAALADFAQTVRLEPGNAQAFYRCGLAYAKLGDLPEALSYLTESLRLDPKAAETYSNRAMVYAMAQEHEQALNDYAHAVRLDPRFAAAYCNQRGFLHASNGWYDRAAADFSVALLLDPENAHARKARERALRKLTSRPQFWVNSVGTGQRLVRTSAQTRTNDVLPIRQSDTEISPRGDIAAANRTRRSQLAGMAKQQAEVSEPPFQVGEEAAFAYLNDSYGLPTQNANYQSLIETSNGNTKSETTAAVPSVSAGTKMKAEDYYREQRLQYEREKAQEDLRTAQLRASQEEKEKRKRAEEAARLAKKRKRSSFDDDDAEGLLVRWRKPLIGVAALAFLAVLANYGMGWFKTHRKIDPPLQAKTVWEEFNKDPQSASQKYANQRFFVVGKLTITKGPAIGTRQVFFQAPAEAKILIKCSFSAPNELAEVPSGATPGAYLVSGEFQPYSEGPFVELTNCEFIGASTEQTELSAAQLLNYSPVSMCEGSGVGLVAETIRLPRELFLPDNISPA